ncbi:hypothetical protein [Roseivivax sp. CAU 1753]
MASFPDNKNNKQNPRAVPETDMSNLFTKAALAAALVVGATMAASADGQWIAIDSEEKFLVAIAGKDLEDRRGNKLRIRNNGEYVAIIGGKEATGTWTWEGNMLCRESANDERSGCQVWEVAGDWVRLNPRSGNAKHVHRYRYK